MIRFSLLLPLLALPLAAFADTSGRRRSIDVGRFVEVADYDPGRRPWMVSPDGRSFITRVGGDVGVYEAATGRELGILRGHADKLHDAGWSRNGRFLATAGYDGTARVWNLQTLKPLAAVRAHDGYS